MNGIYYTMDDLLTEDPMQDMADLLVVEAEHRLALEVEVDKYDKKEEGD